MKVSAPSSSPCSLLGKSLLAESNMTGIWAYSGVFFTMRHNSNPSITGIITSHTTMCMVSRFRISRASWPFVAEKTTKRSLNLSTRNSKTSGLSSTTRTELPDISVGKESLSSISSPATGSSWLAKRFSHTITPSCSRGNVRVNTLYFPSGETERSR